MAISEEEAERLAEELKELNDTRKDMTEQGTEAAKLQVESWYQKDKVLVVFLPECHESLAGIIAGRLREYYQKPATCCSNLAGIRWQPGFRWKRRTLTSSGAD